MDHMMPGMDGIEAVRRIREIGTEYAKSVPVIALTANAIIENEAMFLQNGFQAFLSKPIDMLRMDAVMRQWVRDKEREKELAGKHESLTLSGTELSGRRPLGPQGAVLAEKWRIEGLDLKEGLERFGGDEESLLDVLRSYARHMPALLDQVRAPTEEGLPDYTVVVHGIKSSSYGICAHAVGKRAEVLERAAKAGDLERVRAETAAFVASAEKLAADISAMLDSLEGPGAERRGPAKPTKPAKNAPDEETLGKLRDACAAYEMDGVDEAMAELESFEYTQGRDLVEWLRERVDAMDFRQIQERLQGRRPWTH
jgi:CheY-like chemotaxis protein